MKHNRNFQPDCRNVYDRYKSSWRELVPPKNRQMSRNIIKKEIWDDVPFEDKKVHISRYDGGGFVVGAVKRLFFSLIGKHYNDVFNAFRVRFGKVPNMNWILKNIEHGLFQPSYRYSQAPFCDRNPVWWNSNRFRSFFYFDGNDCLALNPGLISSRAPLSVRGKNKAGTKREKSVRHQNRKKNSAKEAETASFLLKFSRKLKIAKIERAAVFGSYNLYPRFKREDLQEIRDSFVAELNDAEKKVFENNNSFGL